MRIGFLKLSLKNTFFFVSKGVPKWFQTICHHLFLFSETRPCFGTYSIDKVSWNWNFSTEITLMSSSKGTKTSQSSLRVDVFTSLNHKMDEKKASHMWTEKFRATILMLYSRLDWDHCRPFVISFSCKNPNLWVS